MPCYAEKNSSKVIKLGHSCEFPREEEFRLRLSLKGSVALILIGNHGAVSVAHVMPSAFSLRTKLLTYLANFQQKAKGLFAIGIIKGYVIPPPDAPVEAFIAMIIEHSKQHALDPLIVSPRSASTRQQCLGLLGGHSIYIALAFLLLPLIIKMLLDAYNHSSPLLSNNETIFNLLVAGCIEAAVWLLYLKREVDERINESNSAATTLRIIKSGEELQLFWNKAETPRQGKSVGINLNR
jgi:hypothetical protein